jgi:Sigma-70, region 4
MIAVHNFRQSEFRERVTEIILEMLADLPETQRSIFVWNHYRGCQPKQIADILRCGPAEIEATLDAINSILCRRTRILLAEDPQLDPEMELPAASSRKTKLTLQHSVLEPIA